MKLTNNFKVKPKNFQRKPPLSFSETGNKDPQLVLQHCCKASFKVMLAVLPPTFKPESNLICYKTGLMWVVKRTISLFNSFLQQCYKTSCMFFDARFSVTEIAFSQIERSKYAVQSVMVGVFSRLILIGGFLFVL